MEPIILASGSPRRREFFSLIRLPFTVINADIDESQVRESDPEKLTRELAKRKVEKAIEITKNSSPSWICGADTVVALDTEILGKPANRSEAAAMLNKLSGRKHIVYTSVALFCGKKENIDCRCSTCTVNFAVMNDDEINFYLDSNEWQGAAGAYRLQGLAGMYIRAITGEPSAVAGLPLHDFYNMLKDNGYHYGA
jgi:septum formation protein